MSIAPPEVPLEIKAKADAIRLAGGEPRYHHRKGKVVVTDVSKSRKARRRKLPKLDEVIRQIETDLKYWWWTCGLCHISAHATIGYDDKLSDEALTFDRRFDRGFDVDLNHTDDHRYSPVEALLAALEEAKAARDAFFAASGRDEL